MLGDDSKPRKVIERPCRMCGAIVVTPHAWAKRQEHSYCNTSCYHQWQRLHPHTRRGKEAKRSVELKCQQCGIAFKEYARRNDRKYCSLSCQIAANCEIKTCPVCDTVFIVDAEHRRQTHCSKECFEQTMRPSEERWVPCKRCGTLFYSNRPSNKHCSEECRRPPIILSCLTCKKDFRCTPTYASQGRRFCSFRCYRRFTGETEPEGNVRRCLESLGISFRQEHGYGKYSFDFFIPHLYIDLEVDGVYWHERTKDRDARRDAKVAAAGITVIRLPDTSFYGPLTMSMIEHVRNALPASLPLRVPPIPGPIDVSLHSCVHRQLTLDELMSPIPRCDPREQSR